MSPVHTEEALHDYLVVVNDDSILPLGDQSASDMVVSPLYMSHHGCKEMSLVTGDKIKLT